MPEGPEVRRAADQIARALVGRRVSIVYFGLPRLKAYEPKLKGASVESVRPLGKAQVIRFSNGLSLYSHNQLYGKWFVRAAHDYPETTRQLRVALHNDTKSAFLYSASEIAVLTPEEIAQHPFLNRIGPDVLDESLDESHLLERLEDARFRGRRLSALLLDQSFLAGLGNYLRSEILHASRVPPEFRPVDCTIEQKLALARETLRLARQSYRCKGITNDLDRAAALKASGEKRKSYRYAVFIRKGKPCYACGSPVRRDEIGGRRLYWCPSCQG